MVTLVGGVGTGVSVHLVADPAFLFLHWDIAAFIVLLSLPALGKLF